MAAIWTCPKVAAGQNLIANPGFERVFTAAEHQWVQPQGVYYHYEMTDSSSGHLARTGLYVNGLCMYYGEPNEYLHVKLTAPLEAGERYVLGFYARLMRAKRLNAYRQKLIGVHLGRKRLDTEVPGDLYLDPQLNLTLPDTGRSDWFYLSDTLTAEGGEQYLTLGYFAATQVAEDKAKLEAQRRAEWKRRHSPRDTVKDESMAWLYMSPEKQKAYVKAQKKKQKRAGKKNKGGDGAPPPPDFSKPEADWQVPPAVVSADDLPGFFSVRYYFDDFCLRKLGDGPDDCTAAGAEPEWAPGGEIALQNVFFDTDEATLLDESTVQLDALLEVLRDRPGMRIGLRGFTDNRGDPAHNMELSKRRARAVMNWLLEHGVASDRVTAKGYGAAQPIADNDTEGGRARNRRVDFVIREL